MHYESILNSLRRSEPKPHKPAFRIVQEGDGWRLFDGDRALAMYRTTNLDIWAFSPFEPDEISNPEPPGAVVDLHTNHNTYLNFGAMGWPRHWRNPQLVWKWLKTSGSSLEAQVTLAGPDEESCVWLLSVSYDPSRARYRYGIDIAARKLDPEGMESFNMMTAGALEDKAERRRWTDSLWENADGKLRRIVHSNVLFFCTDYAGARDGCGPWRWRYLSYPQGWMAYAAHPTFNPAFLIHSTNVPILAATCSQLFDEHINWIRAGADNIGEDGFFHFTMKAEFVNMPAALTAEMLAKSEEAAHPKAWHHQTLALPFHVDKLNTFNEPLDPWAPEECPILVVPKGKDGAVVWDTIGRNGSHSIRLRAEQEDQFVKLYPGGAVCKVKPHTRCRLSGWIKTEGPTGRARLSMQSYSYSYANILNAAVSETVSGTSDWTRVEVEIDSGEAAYVMPRMDLVGPGTAWFTGLLLETKI